MFPIEELDFHRFTANKVKKLWLCVCVHLFLRFVHVCLGAVQDSMSFCYSMLFHPNLVLFAEFAGFETYWH